MCFDAVAFVGLEIECPTSPERQHPFCDCMHDILVAQRCESMTAGCAKDHFARDAKLGSAATVAAYA